MDDINDFRLRDGEIHEDTFNEENRIYFTNFARERVNFFYEVCQQLYKYIDYRTGLRNPVDGELIFLYHEVPNCCLYGNNWHGGSSFYDFKVHLEGTRYLDGEPGRHSYYEVFMGVSGNVSVIYRCKAEHYWLERDYFIPEEIMRDMDNWRFLLGKWLVFNKERWRPNEASAQFLARVPGWKAEIDARVEAHFEGIRKSILLSTIPWAGEMASNLDVMSSVFSSLKSEKKERIQNEMVV